MQVLATAIPAFGHIGPMLPVCQALVEAGHEVRFATHTERHDLLATSGVIPVAAGMTEADMVSERPKRMPETVGRPNVEWAHRMFGEIMAPAMRADLLAITSSWRPDLIIHDEGEYAAPLVATELGVPWVTHGWGSPLRPVDDLRRLRRATEPMWADAGLAAPPLAGLYACGLIDPCPPFLQTERAGVEVSWPVRPEPAFGHLPSDELDLDRSQPLAYVGFGTVPSFANAPAQIAAAVAACVSLGFRTVVTTTDSSLRDQLVADHGNQVVVRKFVALAGLLGSCKVVVCHAGAGTVLAALDAGTPLVLLPRGAPSQLRMASACEAAGLAVVANPVQPADLADALKAATTTEAHVRARDAAEQLHAMPSAAALVGTLEKIP